MKIALVNPRFRHQSGDPPLGLAYIAGAVRSEAKADVKIFDSTWHHDRERLSREISDYGPDVLGVYANSADYVDAQAVCRFGQEQGYYVVAGGPHATILPNDFDCCADLVVMGEGEHVMSEIVQGWVPTTKIHVFTPQEPYAPPTPALDLLDMNRYMTAWHYLDSVKPGLRGVNILAGRGCLWNCFFCQPTIRELFGKGERRMSPYGTFLQMYSLRIKYGAQGVFFHDDTFVSDRDWVFDLCSWIKKFDRFWLNGIPWGCNARADCLDEELLAKMHEAGCRVIHLGIEAASDRVRNEIYNKRISKEQIENSVKWSRAAGINVMGFFMIGAPTETEEEIEDTLRWSRVLHLTEATFSICTPLPGTFLWSKYVHEQEDGAVYDYHAGGDYFGGVPSNKLKRYQLSGLSRFYLRHPGYVASHFRSLTGMRRLVRKIRRFV